MDLMDNAKQVAGEMREAAKKGASQVRSKVDQARLRRKADGAAKRLGYLVYRERTAGAPAGAEADRLVEEIKDAERQIGTAEAAAAASGPSTSPSTPSVEGADVPPPAAGQAPEEATGE